MRDDLRDGQLATLGEHLWTVPELAQFLGLHEKTVYRLARTGELPCVRLGSRVRFLESDVLRWLSARRDG